MKKFIIIGAGAVGKTYGMELQMAGQEVHYLLHTEYSAIKYRKNRFKFNFSDFKTKITEPNIHQNADSLPHDADFIIVALKTTQNDILKNLLPVLAVNKKTCVIIIQNGIGAEEYVHTILPENPILAAVTTMSAKKTDEPGSVDVPLLGELRLAPFQSVDNGFCKEIQDIFNSSQRIHSPVKIYDNFKQIRWQKLLWNIPFNGLSTLYKMSVIKLVTQEPYIKFIIKLMYEIKNIAEADSAIITEKMIESMLKDTASNTDLYPSMYYDLVGGRPIEVKYIVTTPLEIAKAHDISAPCLTFINKHLTTTPVPLLTIDDLQEVFHLQSSFKMSSKL